jgi:hypothetical protein
MHRLNNLSIILPDNLEVRHGVSLNQYGYPSKAQFDFLGANSHTYLAEGLKGYDGLSSALKLITTGDGCFTFCEKQAVGNRLIGWLHRRHTQLPPPQDWKLRIRIC